MTAILEHGLDYFRAGGILMVPLVLLGLALWFLVGLRIFNLRRGIRGSVAAWLTLGPPAVPDAAGVVPRAWRETEQAVRRGGRLVGSRLELMLLESGSGLARYRRTIRTITMVAPLLGLLGTVRGMIGTFEAMTQSVSALHAHSGGLSGGISEALVTTQVGLFVAIPGLFVGRLLDQKELHLRDDLERVRKWALRRLEGEEVG